MAGALAAEGIEEFLHAEHRQRDGQTGQRQRASLTALAFNLLRNEDMLHLQQTPVAPKAPAAPSCLVPSSIRSDGQLEHCAGLPGWW